MLRKIYRALFPSKPQQKAAVNVIKGNANISIDPSSILITPPTGKITLAGDNYIGRHVEIGPIKHIEIGFGTTLQDRCIILGDVEIGKYCTFAPNVYISSGKHYYDLQPNLFIKDQDAMVAADKSLSQQHSKKVTIGDDCWLGINSVIMAGVTIGRGSVIGANSVVTKDIEPFCVVAGSPAKVIKKRLDFIAKNSISFNNEADLPNFYKGVWVNKADMQKHHESGGLAATNHFVLYMGLQAKKLAIEIKNTTLSPITLHYNKQQLKLDGNEFTTLTFETGTDNYHEFRIDEVTDKNQICVLIKKAELINS